MSDFPQSCVVIKLPDCNHNNFGLELYSPNTVLVARFRKIISDELMTPCQINDPDYEEKRSWGTFHQGSDDHEPDSETSKWEYFEFWHWPTLEFQDKLWTKAFDIAQRLGVPVEIW